MRLQGYVRLRAKDPASPVTLSLTVLVSVFHSALSAALKFVEHMAFQPHEEGGHHPDRPVVGRELSDLCLAGLLGRGNGRLRD